jgi:hypothetical protein
MPVRLPIFPVSTDPGKAEQIHDLAASLFGVERADAEENNGALISRSDRVLVEADRVGGGVWAAVHADLWNPSRQPTPVSPEETYSIARDLLGKHGLLPEFDKDSSFVLNELGAGRSLVATLSKGARSHHQLDTQARYGVMVRNPSGNGPELVPVVGGGGKLTLTLGDGGRPIGLHREWRSAGKAELVEAIEPEEAEARFSKLTSHLEVDSAEWFLAYYAAPSSVAQDALTPVYVFRATIVVGRERIPMRLVTIPATEFGPEPPAPQPQPARKKQPGRLNASLLAPRRTLALGNPFEAGTSWIGLSGGLSGSQANAKGFVDGLAADGWLVNFNWGDAAAWESDWRRNDDTWVDAADFVFYTGHANMNGWVLASPDDGFLNFSEVGAGPAAPGDLWGQQDLEWAVVAACGPLQDNLLAAGGGDVLGRWDGAFDGLHALMGYGAITFDNTEEGKRIVKYGREGTPLIDAWFRTAQEIQPSTNGSAAPDGPDVWVGAMYVTKAGADPRFDHLWGHGSVSADPTSPTTLVCMWTTC